MDGKDGGANSRKELNDVDKGKVPKKKEE